MKNLFSGFRDLLFLYAFLSAIWMLSPFLALYGFIVETNNRKKNSADQQSQIQLNRISTARQVNSKSEALDQIIPVG
ncbi:MAG TPA: hypothetical protein VL442_03740 [Mucilaginibacter sp.]|nr:hypothetical protein [Mucilaginibacter sp.]